MINLNNQKLITENVMDYLKKEWNQAKQSPLYIKNAVNNVRNGGNILDINSMPNVYKQINKNNMDIYSLDKNSNYQNTINPFKIKNNIDSINDTSKKRIDLYSTNANLMAKNNKYKKDFNKSIGSAIKLGASPIVAGFIGKKIIDTIKINKIKKQIKHYENEIDQMENIKLNIGDSNILDRYNNKIEELNNKISELKTQL